MECVTLFVAGVAEYILAALWTRALVADQAATLGAVTFVNVLVWSFVITTLTPNEPIGIVVHGVGCALGATGTLLASRRKARVPVIVPP